MMSERVWNSRKLTQSLSLSGSDSCAIPILSNGLDVWECDLLDVQSLAKYNDMQINSNGNRCFLEISASGSRKDEERSVNHFCASFTIS